MDDFEERITRDTAPAIRLEHDVRYRSARALMLESEVWCDLGCGNGLAASQALGGKHPGRAVLVDVAEDALREAQRELKAADMQALLADLSAEEGLALVREALLTDPPGTGCITCFEVIEHLPTFVPLLELLRDAAETGPYTVVLSVPNDAFMSVQNPYHHSVWGEDAFEGLRRLLPDDHVLALQLELRGSTLVRADGENAGERQAAFELPGEVVASHFVVAFGPRASLLEEPVHVQATDRDALRTWERQRDSDLEFYGALAGGKAARAQGGEDAPPAA